MSDIVIPPYDPTDAYSCLMNLIQFVGSFVTTRMWFGLSVIDLLVIAFIFHFVIGICLGGIVPRSVFEKQPTASNSPKPKKERDWFIEMENKGLDWHTGKYDPALNVLKHKR